MDLKYHESQTILNTSDHLGKFKGKANEGFLVGYAANSYTRFKTNTPAGTQDTNINAGRQDDDSESDCDEQTILVPSFPSNSFSAEKYGFEFSNETAEMLHQAEIDARRNLVLANRDPAGSIVSTGGVPAGSFPASSVPSSSVSAGGVLASSVDSAGFGDPTASESVPAVFNPDHADNSTLPPGHSLGSSEHSTRFPSPSNLRNHQPKDGIFFLSSYDDDFCADVTNLALRTKWILKNKRDTRGIVVRNKARLVAQGHMQEEGIDYDEVFALVAMIEAIRLFLEFASYIGFMVYQMDVKSAFLYGEIEEEVYVTQPKGFEDPHNPKHV
nr:copia protein [Tanacetum cinerariifolium]